LNADTDQHASPGDQTIHVSPDERSSAHSKDPYQSK
jgi:hypothetical protein